MLLEIVIKTNKLLFIVPLEGFGIEVIRQVITAKPGREVPFARVTL